MQTLFSLLSIYIFIMLGFFAKHSFKDRLDEKTLVLMSPTGMVEIPRL
jgi:uncharacterized membrane protein SpoIIM required for sporulation